ncbi:MAG: hypothetical protein QOF76_1574, partial [Solirubrobacteraceae bacterium]|nr:hypothetical protein [Solirubrobacteraceae bacterium]
QADLGDLGSDRWLHWLALGAIAQLGERLDRTQEVGGSSPPSSIRREAERSSGFPAVAAID